MCDALKPTFTSPSTDAKIPIYLGIPSLTLSRGGIGGRTHALDEWWQNKDSHITIQVALLTLVAEVGLNK